MADNDADEAASRKTSRKTPPEAPDSGTPAGADSGTEETADTGPEGTGNAGARADGDDAGAEAAGTEKAGTGQEGTGQAGTESADAEGAGSEGADAGSEGADAGSAGGGDGRTGEGGPDPEIPPRARRGRGRRILKWTAAAVALIVVAAGGTAVVLYERLQGNIHKEHVEARLGPSRPPKLNKSMNILLLGSDSRAGENHQYWSPDISGQRSDTTILLHISPNRDHAVAVSFPRDSMVHVPECETEKGKKVPAFFGMLNAAFAYAGATCTWKMIESTTDIHIDHYVQIDFAGFKRVVDALGGVEICVPQAVNDPRADLYLKAGRQVVKGNAALGYVRTRYGLGDGSDLERIQRQQKFMASVVNKATSTDMLTSPGRLYKFLDAATKSISTDDKFSVSAMRKLATSLKGMSAGTVRFVTVPTTTYPKDPNRVQWDMSQARPLFDAIRKDDRLPAPKPVPAGPAQPKPADVHVTTVNAPKQAVTQLKEEGFHVRATKGPAQPETKILYGAGAERQADALAVDVPGVVIAAGPSVAPGAVSLVVGPQGVQVKAPGIPKVHGEIKANQNPCA